MSSYQRLISYIYAYEGGIKGKNIGFAKLETRGTQCRIMVSVKKIFVGGNPIGVYLLTGGEEIRIGTLFARGGAGVFRTVVNARNVENSGRTLEECCGLSVHDTESAWRAYTTIWEDAVAHAAEVELANVTSKNVQEKERDEEKKEGEAIKNTDTENESDIVSGCGNSALPISSEIERELEKEELESLGILRIRDRLGRNAMEPGVREAVLEEGARGETVSEQAPCLQPEMPVQEPPQPEMPVQEPSQPETPVQEPPQPEMPVQEPSPEMPVQEPQPEMPVQEPQPSEMPVQEPQPEMPVRQPWLQRGAAQEKCTNDALADEGVTENVLHQEQIKSDTLDNLSGEGIRHQLLRADWGQKQKNGTKVSGQEALPSSAIPSPSRDVSDVAGERELWESMRKRYPKILAFDYADGCEILAIKPQDIGLLPRENWVYGNNSFLLHGYYNYRYLILARLNQPGGSGRYLLGVPGHYQSNEKYMAAMFGFSDFVLSKKQPPKDSRFGYWYTDIQVTP